MRSIFRLAIRFLAIRRGGSARFTAAAGLFGIALAVAALIVAFAVTRGFQDELRLRLLAETPHITVTPEDSSRIENWRELRADLLAVADPAEVTGYSAVPAMIIGEKTTAYALITVKYGESGGNSSRVVFGSELARKLDLKPGDEAEAVVSTDDGDVRKVRLRITSVSASGLYDKDAAVIKVSPNEFAAITGRLSETPDQLHVVFRDPFIASQTADRIRAALGNGYSVVEWQVANQILFSALELEKRFALGLIGLIALLAASSVSSSIAILVTERRGDIAVLRTCGANAAMIRRIFLLQAVIIGAVGVLAGIAIGVTACSLANYFDVGNVSAELYMIDRIILAPTISEIALAALLIFTITMIAAVFPAVRAGQVKPLKDLRKNPQ